MADTAATVTPEQPGDCCPTTNGDSCSHGAPSDTRIHPPDPGAQPPQALGGSIAPEGKLSCEVAGTTTSLETYSAVAQGQDGRCSSVEATDNGDTAAADTGRRNTPGAGMEGCAEACNISSDEEETFEHLDHVQASNANDKEGVENSQGNERKTPETNVINLTAQPPNVDETTGHEEYVSQCSSPILDQEDDDDDDVLMIDIENNPDASPPSPPPGSQIIEKDLGCIDVSSDMEDYVIETNFSEGEVEDVELMEGDRVGVTEKQHNSPIAVDDSSGGPQRMDVSEQTEKGSADASASIQNCDTLSSSTVISPVAGSVNIRDLENNSGGATEKHSSRPVPRKEPILIAPKPSPVSLSSPPMSPPAQRQVFSQTPTRDGQSHTHIVTKDPADVTSSPEDAVRFMRMQVNKRKRTEPKQNRPATDMTQASTDVMVVKTEKPDQGYNAALGSNIAMAMATSSAPAALVIAPQPQPVQMIGPGGSVQYRFPALQQSLGAPQALPARLVGRAPLAAAGVGVSAPRPRFIVRRVSPGCTGVFPCLPAPTTTTTTTTTASPARVRAPAPNSRQPNTNFQIRTVQVGGRGTGSTGTHPVTILIPQTSAETQQQQLTSTVTSSASSQQFVMNVAGKTLIPTSSVALQASKASKTVHSHIATPTRAIASAPVSSTSGGGPSFQTFVNVMVNTGTNRRTYTAPCVPAHLHLTDRHVKKCKGCGDSFHTQEGLESHIFRRSMDLTFKCASCLSVLGAHNKCSMKGAMLRHKCYPHLAANNTLELCKVIISPIDEHLLNDSLRAELTRIREFHTQYPNRKSRKKTVESKKKTDESGRLLLVRKKDAETALTVVMDGKAKKDVPSSSTESGKQDSPMDPHDKAIAHLADIRKGSSRCPECKAVYETRGGLAQHFVPKTKHKDRWFQCDKCLTLLPTGCSFRAHMRVHVKEAPYVCPECGEATFNSRDIFMKHVKRACLHFNRVPNWPCPMCDANFRVQALLEAHVFSKHSHVYYKCLTCPMAFRSKDTFDSHNSNTHNDKGSSKSICKCPMCDAVFQSQKQIGGAHLLKHLSSVDSTTSRLYKYICLCCTEEFTFKYALLKHVMKTHPDMIVKGEMCNFCGAEFASTQQLLDHQVREHWKEATSTVQGLICEYCGERFIRTKDLYQHSKEAHAEKLGDRKSPPKYTPPEVNGLSRPRRQQQQQPEEEQAESEQGSPVAQEQEAAVVKDEPQARGDPWQFECDQCQMVFEDTAIYMRHMAKHRFIKKQKRLSGGGYKEKPKKVTLKYKVNKDPMPTSPARQRSPTPEPQLPCPECDAAFFDDDELEEHLQAEHGVRPTFSCHLCGITYQSREERDSHVKRVHEGKLRPDMYSCCVCKEKDVYKSFHNRGGITSHLRIHKVPRPQLMDMVARCRNVKDEEGSEGPEGSTGGEPTPKKLKLDGDAMFTCAKCDYSTEDRAEFSAHITKHQRQRSAAQCQECGLCFAVKPALKRHLFMVHKIRDFSKYTELCGLDLDAAPAQEANIDIDVSNVVIKNGVFRPKRTKTDRDSENAARRLARSLRDEPQSPEPGQCPVCYRKFDGELQLRKHIRNHGMAYIKSRRRASSDEIEVC